MGELLKITWLLELKYFYRYKQNTQHVDDACTSVIGSSKQIVLPFYAVC